MEEDWDLEMETGVPSAPSSSFGNGFGRGFNRFKQSSDNSIPLGRGTYQSTNNGYQSNSSKNDWFDNPSSSVGRGGQNNGFRNSGNRGRGIRNGSANSSSSSSWRNDSVQSKNMNDYRNKPNDDFNDDDSDENITIIRVQANRVGRIIGKGGSKIRELQDESGAKINISKEDSSSNEKTIELTGPYESRMSAKSLIEELCSDDRQDRRQGGGFGDGRQSQSSYFGTDDNCTTVTVLTSMLGRIIGSGGSKIRELQDTTGTQIKIPKDDMSGSYDKSVEIYGSKEGREKAKDMIEELTGQKKNEEPEPSAFTSKIDWGMLRANQEHFEKERWKDAPPLEKNFYIEDPSVANMHPKEAGEIRRVNNNIAVTAFDKDDNEDKDRFIPNPVRNFKEAFQHYPEILDEIVKNKFEKPSPIQCQAWPILLQGLDMIGIAQTGSGKTLAFLLPALIHIEGQSTPRGQRGGANILVILPTRELALQIETEVNKYSYRGIKAVCVYGGGDRRKQVDAVNSGVEILIATPGRLNDLVMAKVIDVNSITYLVLDEADRMLDMGFEPQIMKVLCDIRPDRQTIMTSATWPDGVRRLARKYMKSPIMVYVGSLDLTAVHSVTQIIDICDEEEKREKVYKYINEMGFNDKVIIFVGKKITADDLSSDLCLNNVMCECIHGAREQCDRESALKYFKNSDVRILIATDVASRGLDICDVTHVFNYDFPRNIEEYVHRVGRTGRAGRTGTSITLVTRNDWRNAEELIRILEEADQEVPDELHNMADRFKKYQDRKREERGFGGGGGGGGGRYNDRGFGGGGGRYNDGGFGGGGFGGGGGRRGGRRRDEGISICYDGIP